MKPIFILAHCAAAGAVVVSLITIVCTRGQSDPPQAAASSTGAIPAPASPVDAYRFNPETWQIVGADGLPVEGDLNSQRAVESRRMANLAAVDPDRYEQLFPKSAAERAAIENAQEEIQNPKSLQQRLSEIKDPAELARWTDAIEALTHPVPLTEEMIETAIRNDPKGPWAILRNH
jgi:hypothetical protein